MCFIQAKLNRKLGGKQLRKSDLMSCASDGVNCDIPSKSTRFLAPFEPSITHANAPWLLRFLNNSDRWQSDTLECSHTITQLL